jgi:hypothetical protein
MRATLSYWVLENVNDAGKFVQTLPEADLQNAAATVAPFFAQKNITEALDWAESLPYAGGKETALREIVNRWADNQPAEAARWVLNEPEGNMRNNHIRTVMTQWLAQDPAAARKWLVSANLPAEIRDQFSGQ